MLKRRIEHFDRPLFPYYFENVSTPALADEFPIGRSVF
ncbi:hypothetical protein DB29_03153 [Shouchella clausii]|nr:hypothetical protein DB29_03153 [Shouchella clausii]